MAASGSRTTLSSYLITSVETVSLNPVEGTVKLAPIFFTFCCPLVQTCQLVFRIFLSGPGPVVSYDWRSNGFPSAIRVDLSACSVLRLLYWQHPNLENGLCSADKVNLCGYLVSLGWLRQDFADAVQLKESPAFGSVWVSGTISSFMVFVLCWDRTRECF